MSILLQIGLISGALIAPGLLAVYLARAFSPSPGREPSSEATILSAMTIALALVALEFILLSILSFIDGGWRVWLGLTLRELVSDSPWEYVRLRPESTALIASLEYAAHLILLASLGWINPLRVVIQSTFDRQALREPDPFVDAVREAANQIGRRVVWVSAVLRDGRTYSGTLQSVSFRPLGDGSRELFMQSVERISGGEREPVGTEGTPSGLVLNTRDVIALELAYAEVPSAAGEPAA